MAFADHPQLAQQRQGNEVSAFCKVSGAEDKRVLRDTRRRQDGLAGADFALLVEGRPRLNFADTGWRRNDAG